MSNKTFNTLQARYDNVTPCEPTSLEERHEELCEHLEEINELLHKVEQEVNKVYDLCGEDYLTKHLPYLTFQLDTDTARNEITKYINNEDV